MSSILRRLRKLSRGQLLRHIATLMTGTLIAQAISVLATPLLSRLFTPEDFGVLGLVTGVSMIGAGIAALRYDMAIVLPKEEAEAVNVLLISLTSIAVATAIATLLVLFLRHPLASLFGSPELADWLWAVPPILALTALFNALNFWCTRQKKFRRLSVASVVASLSSMLGKAAGGLASLGPTGLVGGQLGGQVLATLALAVPVLRDDLGAIRRHASAKKMRVALKEHDEFPKYQAPLTLLNQSVRYLPVYLLAGFFGPREVGYWSLTVLVVSTPVFLVAGAARRVLYQRSSELRQEGHDLGPMYRRTALGLLALGALPATAGVAFGPWIFELVLGAEWTEAGEYARYVSIWQLTVLASVPAVATFPVIKAQRLVLVWQVVGIVVSAGALGIGALQGPRIGAAGYSLAVAAMNVALIALVYARIRSVDGTEVAAPTEDADGGGEVREDALLDDRRDE